MPSWRPSAAAATAAATATGRNSACSAAGASWKMIIRRETVDDEMSEY